MKRWLFVVVIVAVLAVPAFSEVRLDLGIDIPRAGGLLSGGEMEGLSETADVLNSYIFPFPEVGVYYNWDFGLVKLGAGGRVFSFILESVFWPNVLAELQFGRVFIDGQLGGLFFGMFGLYNAIEVGKVLIPDLSIWVGLGKESRFRLGGGAMELLVPEVSDDDMLLVFYLGGKLSLLL